MTQPSPKHDTKRRNQPKGRVVDDALRDDIGALLPAGAGQRDMLIENLHRIQDHYGYLHADHLCALADIMRLSQVEVYEVASFYDHFDVVKTGETPPAALTVRVCDSLSCMLHGSKDLLRDLQHRLDGQTIRVLAAPCMGGCDGAPAVRIGDHELRGASVAKVQAVIAAGDTRARAPAYIDLDAYRASGGYRTWALVRAGKIAADTVIATLDAAGLRGLGGAGFPAARKWEIVRSYAGVPLLTVNGDEGEPGTFKDRYYLERDPHRMLEGALIAAHCVGAARVYIYMRDEYPAVLAILRKEIAAMVAAALVDADFIVLRRGAGAYICGEESAMIESLEGKRGLPRHRPPYIAESGLFGRPTLNHNVETLWWIRDIIARGAAWFADQGTAAHRGPRSWSVSGRVKNPGVVLAPAGVTVRQLIDDYCGGMAAGHTFKAYLPGGASGGVLPAYMDDIPLDFGGKLAEVGAFVGSHAVVVLSDKDNLRACVANLLDFFHHESCGQCTPCRVGTQKLARYLHDGAPLDEDLLRDIEQVMRDASICGLGQAAPNPLNHLLLYFREDL